MRSHNNNTFIIGTADDALICFIFHAHVLGLAALAARRDTDTPPFNKSLKPPPVQFSGPINLFNTSIPCPTNTTASISPSASVFLDADANVNATVALVAVGGGTAFPIIAEFELQFGAYSKLNVLDRIAKRLTRRSRCSPRWHHRR